MKIILLVIIFTNCYCLNAISQNIQCSKDNIFYADSLIDYLRPQRGTFKYFYQYKKKADESVPTVIFIPGGPGGTSIDLLTENPYFDMTQIQYGFPSNYNVILTDPRTTGCNSDMKNILAGTYSSYNVAGDIVSIIKSLRLNNYIIYGHSYGTVIATIVASQLMQYNLPQPKAIILSGTVGKYFENYKEIVTPIYYKAWNNVFNHLPEKIKGLFPKNGDWSQWQLIIQKQTIAGLPASDVFNFIFSNLTEGSVYLNGILKNTLLEKLLLLDGHDLKALEDFKKEVLNSSSNLNKTLKSNIFHDTIWCRELEKNQIPECRDLNITFDNPYDSSRFQVTSTKIIYIHGEFDVSVPMESADYHYLNQKNTKKVFLLAKNGGHSTTMAITDCKNEFWLAVANSSEDVTSAVKKCSGVSVRMPL